MNGAMLKLNKVQNKMYVKSNNVPFYVVLFLLTILEFEFEANCEKQSPYIEHILENCKYRKTRLYE